MSYSCRHKQITSTKNGELFGTSLVAQWLRVCLPMQGTRVRALVWEDPTCHGATKPVCHNYWACALGPMSHNCWARMPQLLKPACPEPVFRNKRSHHNEKPAHHNEELPPLTATRESLHTAMKTQHSQKSINQSINQSLKNFFKNGELINRPMKCATFIIHIILKITQQL